MPHAVFANPLLKLESEDRRSSDDTTHRRESSGNNLARAGGLHG